MREVLKWRDSKRSQFYSILKERGEIVLRDAVECGIKPTTAFRYAEEFLKLGVIKKEKLSGNFPVTQHNVYSISPLGRCIPSSDFRNLIEVSEREFEELEYIVEKGSSSCYELFRDLGRYSSHTLEKLQRLEGKGYLESRLTAGKTSPWVFSLTEKGKESIAKAKKMVNVKEKKGGNQPKHVREETSLKTYAEQKNLEFIEERGSATVSEIMKACRGRRESIIGRMKSLKDRGLVEAERRETKVEYLPTEEGRRTVFFSKLLESPPLTFNLLDYPKLLRLWNITVEYESILEAPKDAEKAAQPYQSFLIGRMAERNVPIPEEARGEIIERFKRSDKSKPEHYMQLGTIFGWIESMPEEMEYYLCVLEEILDEEVLDGLEGQIIKVKRKLYNKHQPTKKMPR
jgi:predicted transcriptional regulator